jgi:DNA gyrase/topoisomerase IV subunit B
MLHKRDLPWRNTQDPYLIWLSEIILQQTRVAQGLPYFQNFFDKYPQIELLANAPQDEVLKLWQGLGYYSRARNMHKTAQKIVNDFVNEKLEDALGHHFYDCLIVLNLPPKYVKFGDQNKTRFVTTREEIESLLVNKFGSKLQNFFKTSLYERILKKVEERKNEGYVKKLRAEKRKVNLKHSHKYFPAQKSIAENLFIVEGLSAMGSILQKRNPKEDGVYALKGKIKNCKNIGDLSDNKEILELMHILGLDPTSRNPEVIGYKKIVIATDPDPDGSHITSLLINLFYKWFPSIVKTKRLTTLKIPLVSVGDAKKRKYFWDLDEFKSSKTSGNIRYLKGLGSLSLDDWEWVMKDKILTLIEESSDSSDKLDMAFGDSADARKKWLSNQN